jgi:drug/metabolite transporter superfamily protein YnfA
MIDGTYGLGDELRQMEAAMNRRTVGLLFLLVLAAVTALMPASAPARTSTTYGYVYLVTPKWWAGVRT